MERKGLVIAGLSGGSGKSVVAVGITAALARRGKKVVPFKKGPDYIDAGWLQLAAGQRCYNLDPYLMTEDVICCSFERNSAQAELAVVEGNRGLFDGVNIDGGYSTAELAVMLKLPVVLVVNCTKTTRTIAALVMGCKHFDPRLDLRGVVLNQIATERQRKLITGAVEKYTDVPVLGSIPRLKRDIFPMRHLGMIPHQEYGDCREALDFLIQLVEDNIDLERLEQSMKVLPLADEVAGALAPMAEPKVKIGVLQDEAFQFYYAENLEALQQAGAELIYLNATQDSTLPEELDGLYIGGGFPETSARALAANSSFRQSVRNAAERGMPIYAECGGLIYLGRSIEMEGESFPLVDIFPVRFSMSVKPQAHGYTIFSPDRENPYYPQGMEVKGHEFRYSKIAEWGGSDDDLVLKMERGHGFINGRDGLCYKNVLALYTHIHAGGTPQWAELFVARCLAAVRSK